MILKFKDPRKIIELLGYENEKIVKTILFDAIEEAKKGCLKILSRKEAAEFLQISLPTLHAYSKRGLIKSYRVGHSVRYKVEDLNHALKLRFTHKHRNHETQK